MRLAASVAGEGPPLLIAHGLFGSGRNWGVIAKRLADQRRVISVDMRNHGDSAWADRHDYEAMAQDLADMLDGPADVVGHSMGGKAAMVLALTQPDLVRSLVVVDIAPVAYTHTQRPLIDAMRRADLSGIERRSDVRLDVEDPQVRAFLLQSVDVEGRRWRLNLDVLDAEMDAIVGWPGTEGRYDGPVLALRGGASDYVDEAGVRALRRLFPQVRVETVEGAGHWLHAERPRDVETAIRGVLDSGTGAPAPR